MSRLDKYRMEKRFLHIGSFQIKQQHVLGSGVKGFLALLAWTNADMASARTYIIIHLFALWDGGLPKETGLDMGIIRPTFFMKLSPYDTIDLPVANIGAPPWPCLSTYIPFLASSTHIRLRFIHAHRTVLRITGFILHETFLFLSIFLGVIILPAWKKNERKKKLNKTVLQVLPPFFSRHGESCSLWS